MILASPGFLFSAVMALLLAIVLTKEEKVYYADIEHVNLTYWNPNYYKYYNVSLQRHSGSDPLSYVNVDFETLVALGNNVSVDLSMYDSLNNDYRVSFMELHYTLCRMLFTDPIISPFVKDYFPKGCPVLPGAYHMENISFPNVPLLETFPFTKGRVYGKGYVRGTGERIAEVYVDIAIKQRSLKN